MLMKEYNIVTYILKYILFAEVVC